MRRLPKIMFATGATIIVVVALLVSALRMMLPLINEYRPQIVAKIQSVSGIPLDVGFMQGTWETFGPTLELRDIRAQMPKADLQVQRVTLALDVWQSLLHWRWQFRDLTFYQLQLDLHTTLDATQNNGSNLETGNVHNIFLRQLDRFDLRNSRISFLTPSGPVPSWKFHNSPGSIPAPVIVPKGKLAYRPLMVSTVWCRSVWICTIIRAF